MHRGTKNHKLYKRPFVQEPLTQRKLFINHQHLWRKLVENGTSKKTNDKCKQKTAQKDLKYCFLFYGLTVSMSFTLSWKKPREIQIHSCSNPNSTKLMLLLSSSHHTNNKDVLKETNTFKNVFFFPHPVTLSFLFLFIHGVFQALASSLATCIFFFSSYAIISYYSLINNAVSKWSFKFTSSAQFYHPLNSHVIQ